MGGIVGLGETIIKDKTIQETIEIKMKVYSFMSSHFKKYVWWVVHNAGIRNYAIVLPKLIDNPYFAI